MIDNFNRFVVPNLGLLGQGLWITIWICSVALKCPADQSSSRHKPLVNGWMGFCA